jgi:hypothetical protein
MPASSCANSIHQLTLDGGLEGEFSEVSSPGQT